MRRTFFAVLAACALILPLSAAAIPELPVDDYYEVLVAQADTPPESPAPSVDPELETAVGALGQVFTADGKVNWILAAPLLVWALVFAARKFGGQLIPWLKTKAGGITLALTSGLSFAFLSYALTGGPLTAGVAVAIAVKTLYGFLGSMGLQSGGKNLVEHIKGEGSKAAAAITTGDQAHAKLAELGRGPQP